MIKVVQVEGDSFNISTSEVPNLKRTYSDLRWLHDKLFQEYQAVVPPFPKNSQHEIQNFFWSLERHQNIAKSNVVTFFLSPLEKLDVTKYVQNKLQKQYSIANSTYSQSSATVPSTSASISVAGTSSVSKFFSKFSSAGSTSKPKDYHEDRLLDLQSTKSHVMKTEKLLEKLCKCQKILSNSLFELATKISDWSAVEVNAPFSGTLNNMSMSFEKEGKVIDSISLDLPLFNKAWLESGEKVLEYRKNLVVSYDQSQQKILRKEQALEKLKLGNKYEKIEQAVSEIRDIKEEEEELRLRIEKISQNLKEFEYQYLEKELYYHFKSSCSKYCKGDLNACRSVIDIWSKLEKKIGNLVTDLMKPLEFTTGSSSTGNNSSFPNGLKDAEVL